MTILILILIIIGVAAGVWFLAKRSLKPKESSLPMVVPPSPPMPSPPPQPSLPPSPPFSTPL